MFEHAGRDVAAFCVIGERRKREELDRFSSRFRFQPVWLIVFLVCTILTTCAGMTCPALLEFFVFKIAIFSQLKVYFLSIFKYI